MEFHTMNCAARRVFVPVMAMVLASFSGAAAGADDPAAAIAIAAGHPSLHHVRAEVANERDGETERSTLDVAATTRLERECRADLCHGAWFDGVQSFAFGINGTPFHDREDDDRTERTLAAIESTAFAEPAFAAGGGRVFGPLRSAHSIVRYRVSAPGGAELIAVADLRSQRLTAVERPDGSVYSSLVASGAPPALVYATRGYDRVTTVKEPLDPPAGPNVTVGGAAEIGMLPGGLPIVPCRMANRDARCLIDTGTTPSAMTLAFAERIGREPRGAVEIAGLGSYLTGVVDDGPLDLARARINGFNFAIIPHSRISDFDIIVGSDALTGLRLEVDPGRRRVRVAAAHIDAGESAIALDFEGGVPFADIRLGDRPPESMLVDTGDAGTVSIGYDEYRRDVSLFIPRGRSVAAGLGSATTDALEGELASIDIGAAHLEHVAIRAVRGQHRGHLGFGFAARCERFVLELGERRIECLSASFAPQSPAGK